MLNTNFIKAVDNLQLKYPVSQIAKDLSVSKGTVSSYYNGNIKASDPFLEKFANFYKLELDNLKDQEEKSLMQTEITGVPYYDVDFTADFYSLKHLFLDELDKATNSALNLSKEMASHTTNVTETAYLFGRESRKNEVLKKMQLQAF